MQIPYKHKWSDGTKIKHTGSKAVCVGRNYVEHIRELQNTIPSEPLLFCKPSSAFSSFERPIKKEYHGYTVHYETEIVLLIGHPLSVCRDVQQAVASITGIGIGFDLTLRSLQSELKKLGHPWEKAKAFDDSCILSPFCAVSHSVDWDALVMTLRLDDKVVQRGESKAMIFPIPDLLCYISQYFTLHPGDVVLTGTPSGCGALEGHQRLCASLEGYITATTTIV